MTMWLTRYRPPLLQTLLMLKSNCQSSPTLLLLRWVLLMNGWCISRTRTYTLPLKFDHLPPGDWDPETVVNNSFKLLSATNARIYAVRYAFPNLPVEHKHVWGAYPAGSDLTIKFVNGVHRYSVVRFGWVVNQRLAPASWTTSSYRKGRLVSSGGGTNPGAWTTISNPRYEHDERRVQVQSDIVSGVLIVQLFTVDEPISSIACEDPVISTDL